MAPDDTSSLELVERLTKLTREAKDLGIRVEEALAEERRTERRHAPRPGAVERRKHDCGRKARGVPRAHP